MDEKCTRKMYVRKTFMGSQKTNCKLCALCTRSRPPYTYNKNFFIAFITIRWNPWEVKIDAYRM